LGRLIVVLGLVSTQEPVEVGGHVTFVRDLVTFVGLLVPLECLDENLPDFRSLSSWDASRKPALASRVSNADSR